jgi:putative photosynthetic complex assembly protein
MSASVHSVARQSVGPVRRPAPASKPRRRVPLPPLIALGLFGLIGAIALLPPAPDDGARPVAQRDLLVVAEPDGGVVFRDARDGSVVEHVPADGQSFIRGVFHSLDAYRSTHAARVRAPYNLSELSDGRVLLRDPQTAATIDLEGFGPGNASQFTALLGLPPLKATP